MKYFEGLREINSLFLCTHHTKALKNVMACTIENHIQPGIEMIYVTDGIFDLVINGTTERISTGEIGIIFPFQPHGYVRYEGSEYVRFDFESELAGDFFNLKHDKVGRSAVFKAGPVTEFIIKENFIFSNKNFSINKLNLSGTIISISSFSFDLQNSTA